MENEFIVASYLITGKYDFNKKAKGIAVGLTVGTWTELPEAKKERMAQHLGKVIDITELSPDLDGRPRAICKIGYPVRNLTPDIPALLTTVFGKCSMDGAIKCLDIEAPEAFLSQLPGPKLGIDKIRERLGIKDRPLLMSIFKQCIGMTLKELEEAYQNQIAGGVDLVKDDEIFFRDDAAPVMQRVRRFKSLSRQKEERTGQVTWYAVNLTGPVTEMADQAKRLVEQGADCLLLNVLPYGFDILHRIAADPDVPVPVMAHPSFSGAIYPSGHYGVSAPLLLGKLMRWAGADIVLYPSPYGSVAMPREDALAIAGNLRIESAVHQRSFPAPAAGIHPGLVPVLFRDFGNDLLVNAGGGIHGHPQGAAAGGKAFVDAIRAAMAGESLKVAAQRSPELQAALDQWGCIEE
ncbi:2,3-diketo-5-methylthiopentyl-1-phosphate enolase [Paenactinomyces guangxiensis]|uniref:2,3-diketo-5-methylthiopentyl-1-phosphate enolase n=1 Tax=Paenactinomyces guangxiensis TaxID=1490290 RepID=A0A7W2A8N4_9BACL|nr:2,3-diketo-5-methylthiopentyl-1-phosphate enolase [Paenactinomyces guangxiensis]MBA4494357.1 2,3-diketo-5-methylthiopentyl-1-phosphate enolase [Paenactinomyces guangxiensis]MBH8591588.1 2,3-diketo-5-methylthiopentyl-1-phosphate enolase [Paenactinomyces guangxiensis]